MVTTHTKRKFNGGSLTGADGFNSVGGGDTSKLTLNSSTPLEGAGDAQVQITGTATNVYGVIDTKDDGVTAYNEAEAWIVVRFKVTTHPSVNTRAIRLRNGGSTTLGGLQLTNATDPKLRLVDQGSTPISPDSSNLTAGGTFEAMLRYKQGAAGAGVYEAYWRNLGDPWGSPFASGTHSNNLPLTSFRVGINDNATADVDYDVILVGDTGAPSDGVTVSGTAALSIASSLSSAGSALVLGAAGLNLGAALTGAASLTIPAAAELTLTTTLTGTPASEPGALIPAAGDRTVVTLVSSGVGAVALAGGATEAALGGSGRTLAAVAGGATRIALGSSGRATVTLER